MIRRPPRSTQSRSSAASDVYKRQDIDKRSMVLKVCGSQSEHSNIPFHGLRMLLLPKHHHHNHSSTHFHLQVSERSKGVRLPIRGLAGAVIQTNRALNIADAYQDERFDATMDRRTGYRTRQVLGVPLRHSLTGETIGLLQVNNRLDGSLEPFTLDQQRVLEIAAEQLSELLFGRADIVIHSSAVGSSGVVGGNKGMISCHGHGCLPSSSSCTSLIVEIVSDHLSFTVY